VPTFEENSFEDRAHGCILGAFIGDSCGSYNEFCTKIRDNEFMDKCMEMNGGGPFKLAAGQVTDDSELAMCAMTGIIENDEDIAKGNIDMNKIAARYSDWIGSSPFDIGNTTRAGLGGLIDPP
jgi:ADP-ribosylglycohydrolase